MCHECGDDYEENEFNINQLSPDELNSFADFACAKMALVIENAEANGVLHQLITEWSDQRIIQFELATVMGQTSLDEHNW